MERVPKARKALIPTSSSLNSPNSGIGLFYADSGFFVPKASIPTSEGIMCYEGKMCFEGRMWLREEFL
jgi:hypothetical protein